MAGPRDAVAVAIAVAGAVVHRFWRGKRSRTENRDLLPPQRAQEPSLRLSDPHI